MAETLRCLTHIAGFIMLVSMIANEPSDTGAFDALVIADYVDHAAMLTDIPLDGERRQRVIHAFIGYQQAATLLMDFPLPSDVEPASVYTLP